MQSKGYNQDFLDRVKDKNDIVSVISKYIRLDKKGKNFWACCPFHHEKTPSFCINETEQFYKCFGCGESGNIITFLMKYEQLSFSEAIKQLAENAGIELPRTENSEAIYAKAKEKQEILQAINFAKEFYKKNLYQPKAKEFQEYIKKRNLKKSQLEDFEIGCSLNWKSLPEHLTVAHKISLKTLKDAGLIDYDKNGQAYDVMAERLVFPIINSMGDCIGFSGRDISGKSNAKYKNTPATMVFEKSKEMYGINLIKKNKQQGKIKNIILVEGQFDVITMHKNGFIQTLASLGTAFSAYHAKILKRFADDIILLYDGDEAGQKAALRTTAILEETGLNVKLASLPKNSDPDDFLKQNSNEKLQELLDKALSPIDYQIHKCAEKYNLSKPDEKAKFVSECYIILKALPTEFEKDIYLKLIVSLTNIPFDVLRKDFYVNNTSTQIKKADNKTLSNEEKAVNFILAAILFKKPYAKVNFDFSESLNEEILRQLYRFCKEKYDKGENYQITAIFDVFDTEKYQRINEILNVNFEKIQNEEQYFKECLWLIYEKQLLNKQTELLEKYNSAEAHETRKKIAAEIQQIAEKLKKKNLEEI